MESGSKTQLHLNHDSVEKKNSYYSRQGELFFLFYYYYFAVLGIGGGFYSK